VKQINVRILQITFTFHILLGCFWIEIKTIPCSSQIHKYINTHGLMSSVTHEATTTLLFEVILISYCILEPPIAKLTITFSDLDLSAAQIKLKLEIPKAFFSL